MKTPDTMNMARHSAHYQQMVFNTQRRGIIKHPTGYGKNTGQCGDTVEIFLIVKEEILKKVTYRTDGCINTNACAATVAYLAEGKSIDRAWEIDPNKVILYLKTLPMSGIHYAELTVGGLYKALASLP